MSDAAKEVVEVQENSFPNKYMTKLNKLATGFTDGIDSADTEEIKRKILISERDIFESEQDKENNPKIKEAKEILKEMTDPYAEHKGLETAKIKYCLFVLQSRGAQA